LAQSIILVFYLQPQIVVCGLAYRGLRLFLALTGKCQLVNAGDVASMEFEKDKRILAQDRLTLEKNRAILRVRYPKIVVECSQAITFCKVETVY
jgi:hypothetical protein